MKLLTCAAIIALSMASAAFAQTSPDQSQTHQGNPTPQHTLAPSSPSGMGGPNATAPSHSGNPIVHGARGHGMNRSAKNAGNRHRAGRSNADENRVTMQLNREQLSRNGAQSATQPSGTSGVGPMP
jgi:hypothetical protein